VLSKGSLASKVADASEQAAIAKTVVQHNVHP